MSVMYGNLNVDERYSSILEPNLYHDSVFADGLTFTSKYEIGPAGGIFVHKLATTPCAVGTPGRDFSDEATADTLIPIVLNNNYQKSKKIYGVQASAVAVPLASAQLEIATKEVSEYWENVLKVADKVNFKDFVDEKIGYPTPVGYGEWLELNHYNALDSDLTHRLYEQEQAYLEKNSHRSLKEIATIRLKEFQNAVGIYNK